MDSCCQRATDEELASDPEAFSCETCTYRQLQSDLSDHDRMALRAYHLLQSPVVRDLKLTQMVFDILGIEMKPSDALLLLDKLDIIHRALAKPDPLKDALDE